VSHSKFSLPDSFLLHPSTSIRSRSLFVCTCRIYNRSGILVMTISRRIRHFKRLHHGINRIFCEGVRFVEFRFDISSGLHLTAFRRSASFSAFLTLTGLKTLSGQLKTSPTELRWGGSAGFGLLRFAKLLQNVLYRNNNSVFT